MSAFTRTIVVEVLITLAFTVFILWPVLRAWIIRGPVLKERAACGAVARSWRLGPEHVVSDELQRDRHVHNEACDAIARMIRSRTGVPYVDR